MEVAVTVTSEVHVPDLEAFARPAAAAVTKTGKERIMNERTQADLPAQRSDWKKCGACEEEEGKKGESQKFFFHQFM